MLLRNLSAFCALLLTGFASATSAEGQPRDASSEVADIKSPGDYCNDGDVHQQMRCRMKLSVARNLCFFSDPDPNKCLARAMRAEEEEAAPRPDIQRCVTGSLQRNETAACSLVISASGASSHDKAVAYSYRAYAQLNQRAFQGEDDAASDVKSALKIDPNVAMAHFVAGAILSMPGSEAAHHAGIVHLNRAIELGVPSRLLALAYSFRAIDHESLGAAAHDKAEYRLAVEDFGRELKLNPNAVDAYSSRAQLEQELGMTAEYRADLATYHRLHGDQ